MALNFIQHFINKETLVNNLSFWIQYFDSKAVYRVISDSKKHLITFFGLVLII